MTDRHADAAQVARRAADSPWVQRGARLGFAARGVVYLLIGVIAAQVALGRNGDDAADRSGALQRIADTAWGTAALAVLTVGLVGYALWRFTEAIWGKRDETDARKRAVKRLASAAKGIAYAAFALTTASFAVGRSPASGSRSSGGASGANDQEQEWTARVMGWPGGRVLVAAIGVAIVAGGGYLVVRGLTTKFEKRLDTARMDAHVRTATHTLGMFGVSARGVVFALAGLLLVKAALDFDPGDAQGLDGTLRSIAQRQYGTVLLLAASVGLLAFGAYSFAEARYRRL